MEIGTRSGAGLCGWLIGRMETLHALVGWVTLLLIVWMYGNTVHTGREGWTNGNTAHTGREGWTNGNIAHTEREGWTNGNTAHTGRDG